MSAIFEIPISSEDLEPDEIKRITGCPRKCDQIGWLDKNKWFYHTNKAGEPVIGRLYARLKMAGINPAVLAASGGWSPDLSQVR